MKTPCPECPWSRSCTPGALGGSPPETYIGQVVQAFWLPCHMNANYDGKESDINCVNDCHGAAIFRSNISDDLISENPSLLRLPPNKELVFENLAEFYAHHKKISLAEAKEYTTYSNVLKMAQQVIAELADRMAKGGKVIQLKKRK